jgi:tetratricopeptide (TPR) repeat protein
MLNLNPLKISKAKADFFSMKLYPNHRLIFFLLLSLIIYSSVQFSFAQEDEKDPVQLFNQGQDAHEKGDFKTALKLYEEAIKIAPEFPEAEFQRGNALQSLGNEAEAEKAFRRAIELKEDWVLPMTSLGEILVKKGNLAEAETILNKVIQLDANNSQAYLALVELNLKTKSSPENLKNLLDKLKSLSNQDASIWAARGALESNLGDKTSAKSSLEKSLSLESRNEFALTELTNILLAENNFERAYTTAQNLVKFYPNSARSSLLLARVFAASGKIDESLKILDSLDSQNNEVSQLKNEIITKGSKDIGMLEKQLQTDVKNPTILGRLCTLTRTVPSKALEYCRRASEAEPNNMSHAVGFGAALVQAKQFENAVNLFRRLLSIEQDNYLIHANLAAALFELNRFDEAKTEYQWLISQKPDLAIAYYFLAIAHDNLQEYSDAQSNYQKFLKLADSQINQLEIDKVNLRLPILEKQIKQGAGKKKGTKQ